jgi:hypothetical protein
MDTHFRRLVGRSNERSGVMLGRAAVAMWWDIAAEMESEFEHWHSIEHMPERLSIPGFRRGTRWKSNGGSSYFVLYEARSFVTISSGPYLERLNNPTPWSQKLVPQHRNMVRSLCRVRWSSGAFISRALLTVRITCRPRRAQNLTQALGREVLPALAKKPQVVGAHLLESVSPPGNALTTEQKIRGGDATADRVILVSSYDPNVLDAIAREELGDAVLTSHGGSEGALRGFYLPALSLVFSEITAT